jgi:hypothetical protein
MQFCALFNNALRIGHKYLLNSDFRYIKKEYSEYICSAW